MITGKQFIDAVISAANNLNNNKESVNNLNVFPVPDGDTGTNMTMTITSAKSELSLLSEDTPIGVAADTAALAMLKGARGNSGVILSLLFRGFSKQFKGKTDVNAYEFAKGLELGVKNAYGAVRKPTEGTILTVARVASEKALRLARSGKTETEVMDAVIEAAAVTLADTPKMLPVLKQANVVDAGGRGLLHIFEGMGSVLKDGVIIETEEQSSAVTSEKADFGEFDTEDIKFAYCTELVIERGGKKDPADLNAFLQKHGDSIVFVPDDTIIKLHVHTNNPGKVIEEGLKFGSLINIKVENMKLQHTEKVIEKPKEEKAEEEASAEPVNDYGFVTVCAGEGLASIFKDLGADTVVEGGQTMNPSTDDLLKAVRQTPAKTVFILPNNKNIIMAAEQVAPIADRHVVVIPTKTIPQGISAMLGFDAAENEETNVESMTESLSKVRTANITFAARDSVFDGLEIKEGEYLGLIDGKVTFVETDLDKCFKETVGGIIDGGTGYVNVFYGNGASEDEAERLVGEVETNGAEVNIISGGQPVYYYIISAE